MLYKFATTKKFRKEYENLSEDFIGFHVLAELCACL